MTQIHPTDDASWVLDDLCEFPWSIGTFSELRRYAHFVVEFLPHATAQKEVRLRARINSETDPVAIGEFESELEDLQRDESLVLPRIVWGGILVSTYAAFEFGLESIFNFWRVRTKHSIPFKQQPGKDFLSSAATYAKDQIGIPLFASPELCEKLIELKELRNSFVHRGGRLSTLSPKFKAKLVKRLQGGIVLKVVDDHWLADARSVEFYVLVTQNVIRSFGDAVAEKYLSHRRVTMPAHE